MPMTKVVTVRLSGELLRRIDRLISEGHFRSRSEAFRAIIEGYLNEHPELLIKESLESVLQEAPDLSDEELLKLGSILFKDSVAKLVAEGRER